MAAVRDEMLGHCVTEAGGAAGNDGPDLSELHGEVRNAKNAMVTHPLIGVAGWKESGGRLARTPCALAASCRALARGSAMSLKYQGQRDG
ncbi:hypothetical protein GCM10027066_27490 [Dyella jejuensis]